MTVSHLLDGLLAWEAVSAAMLILVAGAVLATTPVAVLSTV